MMELPATPSVGPVNLNVRHGEFYETYDATVDWEKRVRGVLALMERDCRVLALWQLQWWESQPVVSRQQRRVLRATVLENCGNPTWGNWVSLARSLTKLARKRGQTHGPEVTYFHESACVDHVLKLRNDISHSAPTDTAWWQQTWQHPGFQNALQWFRAEDRVNAVRQCLAEGKEPLFLCDLGVPANTSPKLIATYSRLSRRASTVYYLDADLAPVEDNSCGSYGAVLQQFARLTGGSLLPVAMLMGWRLSARRARRLVGMIVVSALCGSFSIGLAIHATRQRDLERRKFEFAKIEECAIALDSDHIELHHVRRRLDELGEIQPDDLLPEVRSSYVETYSRLVRRRLDFPAGYDQLIIDHIFLTCTRR